MFGTHRISFGAGFLEKIIVIDHVDSARFRNVIRTYVGAKVSFPNLPVSTVRCDLPEQQLRSPSIMLPSVALRYLPTAGK